MSWFFHTPGSGIFLDCRALPVAGTVAVYADREEWRKQHGWQEWVLDDNIREAMEQDGQAMLIFLRAGFTVFNQAGHNPSTEVIVRHASPDSSELSSARGSCLDDPSIGIVLRTGLDGSLPCRCRVRDPPFAAINCDGTPWPDEAFLPPAPTPTPPLPALPRGATPLGRMLDAFNQRGWFLKATTCHGQYCDDDASPKAHAWLRRTLASTTLPPAVETDCGRWCAATSYLNPQIPFAHFTFRGYSTGLALVFDANEEMWNNVQCMATTDSSTSTRACCACGEERFCPFDNFQSDNNGYCHDCTHSATCRQLAAGCGISVFDVSTGWGDQQCSREEIAEGKCALCTRPLWVRAPHPHESVAFETLLTPTTTCLRPPLVAHAPRVDGPGCQEGAL